MRAPVNRARRLASALFVAALIMLPGVGAGAVLFALVDTGEIYSSGDGGTSWGVLATVPAHDAVGLAAGASTSQLFLATRSGTVYGSTDAGASWTAVGAITASDVAAFTINPDQSILALTESGTVYVSMDGGASFAGLSGITSPALVSLTRGPLGRLYALSRTGEVYESQDAGATWAAVGGISVSNAASIRQHGIELFILTRTGEVYRSQDFGRAWTPVGTITASDMRAILDLGPTLVAAAETGEVYTSFGGSGWSAVGSVQQLRVMALGVDTPVTTGVPVGTPRFTVFAPYPNPARLSAGSSFAFEATRAERLHLDLYDVRGRRVASRASDVAVPAGPSRIRWAPDGVAPGTYFLRITSESGERVTVKWSLVR
jgi:photosystem II stability/assembly factor-like uncharacterized protein